MKKANVWLYGGAIAVAVFLVLVFVKSKQPISEDPLQKEILRKNSEVYVCSVLCKEELFKKWLGSDYGTLVDFGTGSRGIFELKALPKDKEKAMRRIDSIATEHGLRIY